VICGWCGCSCFRCRFCSGLRRDPFFGLPVLDDFKWRAVLDPAQLEGMEMLWRRKRLEALDGLKWLQKVVASSSFVRSRNRAGPSGENCVYKCLYISRTMQLRAQISFIAP